MESSGMEHIATIMTSFFTLVSGIIVAWFTYNQKTKDKMTSLKIEQIKVENEDKHAKNNRHIAMIYGELYRVLNKADADRCFILQPHPEGRYSLVSVVFEVVSPGISEIKNNIQNLPMSEIAGFSNELSLNYEMRFDNIEEQIKDNRTKSLMRLSGATNIVMIQLVNSKEHWNGTLITERIASNPFSEEAVNAMKSTATTIQYILPPIV